MTPNFCTIVREFENKLFVQFVMHVCFLRLSRMLVGLLKSETVSYWDRPHHVPALVAECFCA